MDKELTDQHWQTMNLIDHIVEDPKMLEMVRQTKLLHERMAEAQKKAKKVLSQPGANNDERKKASEILTKLAAAGIDFTSRTNLLPSSDAPSYTPEFLKEISAPVYQALQAAIAAGDFATSEDRQWPTADLSNASRSLVAFAEQKPKEIDTGIYYDDEHIARWQEQMGKEVSGMDDETADVLDAVSYVWLENAKNPESFVHISSDDGLKLRGLKPKKNSSGYGNQYTPEQYKKWAFHLNALCNTWITVSAMDTTEIREDKKSPRPKRIRIGHESRAISIDDRYGEMNLDGKVDPSRNVVWKYKMGSIFAQYLFGPGRQVAYIHKQALMYEPIKQKWEKRLARYLAWQWRIRQGRGAYMEPYKIETLLAATKESIDPDRPARTKERLEKALDRLMDDGVIKTWQYEQEWDEKIVGKRHWWKDWKLAKITIEPPDKIMDHYLKHLPSCNVKQKELSVPDEHTSTTMAEERKRRGLSIMQAAEQIGISMGSFSQAERGMKIGRKTLSKIEDWIGKK